VFSLLSILKFSEMTTNNHELVTKKKIKFADLPTEDEE